MKDVLIVFARYPEPGKCKTRLIPKLGIERATQLHAEMTQHTLAWAREIAMTSEVRVEVHFDGGDAALMSEQFGDDLDYVPQQCGDLGEKLRAAFHQLADAGVQRIVVVGTDCPQLSGHFVGTAFARLSNHEACVAPAEDGGYVLLGISANKPLHQKGAPREAIRREVIDNVYREISWGRSNVLSETISRLCELDATCALLPTLADVDTPDDLIVWEQASTTVDAMSPEISVIIPTFNEEPNLANAIDSSNAGERSETIVVAAGDFRATLRIAAQRKVQCLISASGKAVQMNMGASHANAQWLLFLHADTLLPVNYTAIVREFLSESNIAAGAFRLRIDSQSWLARLVEFGVSLRSRVRQLPYGDQAIFLRRDSFEKNSGYKNMPIMEDYELMRRLRREGRIAISSESVCTSSRRWQRLGFLRTTVVNQLMIIGYHLGVSLETLAKLYRRG